MSGKCIIFSAPSGSGKTTLVQHLLKRDLGLEFSISATTREKRKIELAGKDYHYMSVSEFKNKIVENEFVEYEEVYTDNFYGTLKSEIDRIWGNGATVIFDVDVVGGLNLKKYFGDKALAIFVKAPSIAHLRARLEGRDTETEASIARRMGKAEVEMGYANQFDYVLLNDNLEHAQNEIEEVVKSFIQK